MYARMYVCMYVRMYVCTHVCSLYVCTYVCMYVICCDFIRYSVIHRYAIDYCNSIFSRGRLCILQVLGGASWIRVRVHTFMNKLRGSASTIRIRVPRHMWIRVHLQQVCTWDNFISLMAVYVILCTAKETILSKEK